jgi:glycosyltransferase involved in cell wall biosynthesis
MHPPRDGRIFHKDCCTLARAGYDVHLLCHGGEDGMTDEGVRLHSLGPLPTRTGLQPLSRLGAIWRASRAVKKLPASLYHLRDPELIPLGVWLKLTTKAKVVFDSREDNVSYVRHKHYIPKLLRPLVVAFAKLLDRSVARWFDAVVTADAGTAELFKQRGARRICVLHNFPIMELMPYAPAAVENQDRPFDLVYHGCIPQSHLECAFAVAEELRVRGRVCRWLMFGWFNDRAWAETEAARRGLSDCFTFEGSVPHERVADKVRTAKIGFIPLPDLPKFHNNLPMKLFEYMALGMPAVLSDLPPSRRFVGDGKCAIMVRPDDYSAYADAIERLLDNPDLRVAMGREGRRRVEEQYNWGVESQALLKLYEELLPS